jgi:hypothetical protein
MFPDALIEEIRERALEIYEHELGVTVDTSHDPNAICPFHADRSPSLYISPAGLWYCQPCAMGGDVFSFVEKACNAYGFVEAVKAACGILALPIPTAPKGFDPNRDVQVVTIRRNVKRVRERVKSWYSSRMTELVTRAQQLEQAGRQVWRWATEARMRPTDSIWDKCIDWASEARQLDEERLVLVEAREFEAQLLAFETHHGPHFTPRTLGLSREAYNDVRKQLVGRPTDSPHPGPPRPVGPGLFGAAGPAGVGAAQGDPGPERVETGEDGDGGGRCA